MMVQQPVAANQKAASEKVPRERHVRIDMHCALSIHAINVCRYFQDGQGLCESKSAQSLGVAAARVSAISLRMSHGAAGFSIS